MNQNITAFKINSSRKTHLKYIALFLMTLLCMTILSSQIFAQPLAEGQSKFLGNIIGRSIPADFNKYWNQITPENAGKWANVESEKDVYAWHYLDSIYNYAVKNGFQFKFHNLVWGKQQPGWIKNLSPAEQAKQVEEWIKLSGQRYPKTNYVDVVNEPIRTSYDTSYPPYYEAIGGKGKTGWDWVIWSFEQARKYFPDAKLLINEYNILNGQKPVDEYIQLIKLLKERNLIDGIGCQGHSLEETDTGTIRQNLEKLEKLGLPIYISEYDVNNAEDARQLEIYKEQFPLFWQSKFIKGITLWGYIENEMWRTNAYLVKSDGTERPALKWLRDYLKENKQVK